MANTRVRQVSALDLGNIDFAALQQQCQMVARVADGQEPFDMDRELAEGLWEFLSHIMERCADALGSGGEPVVYGARRNRIAAAGQEELG
jgi:hypothetical protein